MLFQNNYFCFHNLDLLWNIVPGNLVKTELRNFQNFPSWKVFSYNPNFHFNRLIIESEHQKQRRQNFRDGIEKVCSSNKEAANVLKSFNRKQPERPCIKAEQLELLSSIVKLVQNSTAADEHRRTECICSIITLDDLHKELTELGFHLSWSTLYLCLIPCICIFVSHKWRKDHVNMVPFKLLRPENSLREKKRRLYVYKIFN